MKSAESGGPDLPPPSHHHAEHADEELAIAQVEEMQAVSAVLRANTP